MPRGVFKRKPHFEKTKNKIRQSIKKLWKNFEYRNMMSKPRNIGKNHPNWKGGKVKRSKYFLIYIPTHSYAQKIGYVLEHRLIIEKQIGRYLLPKEMSHHINRIKTDNRPENLMAFSSRSAHVRFEKGGKVNPKEIIFDGRNHFL